MTGSNEAMAPDEVLFTAQPSSRDLVLTSAALTRSSALALALGSGFLVLWLIGSLTAIAAPAGLVALATSIVFLTGSFVVPFVLWGIWRRADLVLAPTDFRATAESMTATSPVGSSTVDWSAFRSARELPGAFILDTGAGTAMLVAKRGIDDRTLDMFRRLLVSRGLIRPPTMRQRLRPIVWILAGSAAAFAYWVWLVDPFGR